MIQSRKKRPMDDSDILYSNFPLVDSDYNTPNHHRMEYRYYCYCYYLMYCYYSLR